MKAAAILDAWALVGLDGVAFSADDWRIGRADAEARAKAGLPILAANLVCDGVRPFPASRVIERGGWKVGVVGVTAGTIDGCTVEDPFTAAQTALAALGDVDVRVLLAPVSVPDQRKLSDATLPVDVIVDPSGRTDPIPPAWGGGYALAAGSRGKELGVATFVDDGATGPWRPAGIVERLEADKARLVQRRDDAHASATRAVEPTAKARFEKQVGSYDRQIADKEAEIAAASGTPTGGARGFTVQLHELGTDIADHAPTAAIVAKANAALGPATDAAIARRAAPGGAYAGADACASCHAAETTQWRGSAHASAWASLVNDGRAADADCTPCHATGVGTGGPTGPADVGGLRDVQCEACHGAGAAHVAAPAVTHLVKDPAVETCRACHDGERDGGRFEPAGYRARVVHRALTSLQR